MAWAMNAVAMNSAPTPSPHSAPPAAQATSDPGKATAGELSGESSDRGRREHDRSHPLNGRAPESASPIDGCEKRVAHIGLFESERSPTTSRAQTEGNGQYGGQAEPAGSETFDVDHERR